MIVVRPFAGVFATETVLPAGPEIPQAGTAVTRSAPAVYAVTDTVIPRFTSPGARQMLYTGPDASGNPYGDTIDRSSINQIPGVTGGGRSKGSTTPPESPAPPPDPGTADPAGTAHEDAADNRGIVDMGPGPEDWSPTKQGSSSWLLWAALIGGGVLTLYLVAR